ncbi:MAG: glutathione S-transferase family protein [Xenococcaceae cyanobacterium MO_188.B29]|nr:glutathione S-transferase family protein [Xenococcaceae cyanobacterium MO_188.B29]
MILYGIKSFRSLRVHWTLHELNIPYVIEPIESRTGQTSTSDYTKIHLGQKIPYLQDGKLGISESAAICIYLAEKYGNGKLIPITDINKRARFFQICFYAMTELDAHTLYIIAKHGGSLVKYYKRSDAAVEVAVSEFNKQILVAERWLKNPNDYIMGEVFTVADILFCTCLMSAYRLAHQFPLEIPEKFIAYTENLENRKAFQLASIANQTVAL